MSVAVAIVDELFDEEIRMKSHTYCLAGSFCYDWKTSKRVPQLLSRWYLFFGDARCDRCRPKKSAKSQEKERLVDVKNIIAYMKRKKYLCSSNVSST